MPYDSCAYEFLFNQSHDTWTGSVAQNLCHANVFKYRAKIIESGNVLECEIYPIWNTQNEVRKAKELTTRQAQTDLNDRNAKKKLIRKINTNFTDKDLCVTLTYRGFVPDEEQAQKDIRNYIRRVRDFRKKHGLPELKYMYVIEFTGDGGRAKKRVHHHVIMSGMDRDEAEKIWGKGFANTRRLQPDAYGLEALARYVVKDPSGRKRWCASKNLVDPKVTCTDTKLSKRQVERMARDMDTAAPLLFAKLFPDYALDDCTIKRSEYVSGAYVYCHMHRTVPVTKKVPKTAKGKASKTKTPKEPQKRQEDKPTCPPTTKKKRST